MKVKKNNVFIQHKNNANKTGRKLIHKKKPTFLNNDFKSSKLNENNLYTLRNQKIIEKKNFIQRKRKYNNNHITKKRITTTNLKNVALTPTKENLKLNTDSSKNIESLKSPATTNASISFTRTFIDAESKLKILDLYNHLNSYDETSKATGVHSQTIRYWKKTENSIKEKVLESSEIQYHSSSLTNLETMITEAKDSLKRSLSKNTTTIKLVTRKSRLKSPNKSDSLLISENKSAKKNSKNKMSSDGDISIKQKKYKLKKKDSHEFDKYSNNRIKDGKKKSQNNGVKNKFDQEQSLLDSYNNSSAKLDIDSLYMEVQKSLKHQSRNITNKYSGHQKSPLTSVNNCNSQISNKQQGKINERSNNPKSTNSHITNSKYLPNVESIESIVDEINKLTDVFKSKDCLESLRAHFQNLQSERGNEINFHNSLLLAKNKMQDENFKHIMTDFFQGEYKLLMEINHQYQQLKQKKSKNMNKNLENLKNYFKGSMHRLLVLKEQLT